MAELAGEWNIVEHRDRPVLEIVYPAKPSPGAIDRYEAAFRNAVEARAGGVFDAIVDQRAMPILSAELADRIVALKLWAREHGLRQVVRVIRRSAIAELQARKLLRDAGIDDTGKVLFFTPEEAMAQVTGDAGAAHP